MGSRARGLCRITWLLLESWGRGPGFEILQEKNIKEREGQASSGLRWMLQ